MKNIFTLFKSTAATGIAIAAVAVALSAIFSPAIAHEAPCPYCKLKLVQNTETQDNEVIVVYGNKKIEYRCIYCVFADQDRFKGDLTVQAPSETKGAPIIIKRTEGKWSAPDSTVFLSSFKRHKTCAAESRAFTSRAAFDAYVKAQGITDAKPLTLAEELDNAVKKAKTDASDKENEEHEDHHDSN